MKAKPSMVNNSQSVMRCSEYSRAQFDSKQPPPGTTTVLTINLDGENYMCGGQSSSTDEVPSSQESSDITVDPTTSSAAKSKIIFNQFSFVDPRNSSKFCTCTTSSSSSSSSSENDSPVLPPSTSLQYLGNDHNCNHVISSILPLIECRACFHNICAPLSGTRPCEKKLDYLPPATSLTDIVSTYILIFVFRL